MKFHLLPLPSAKTLRNSSLVLRRAEEVLLIGRALIGVAGRDRDADAELLA